MLQIQTFDFDGGGALNAAYDNVFARQRYDHQKITAAIDEITRQMNAEHSRIAAVANPISFFNYLCDSK